MKRILDQIELFLLCFTVFMIPIHIKLTSVSIGLLIIVAFMKKDNYKEFARLYKNPKFLILVAPYFIALIGLLNTEYMADGRSQIEIITSLIAFPIIFTSYKSNTLKNRPELIQSFLVLGVIAAYFICFSVAIPRYLNSNDINWFFYMKFSGVIKGPHHLSYYVLFVIIILVSGLIKKTPLLIPFKGMVWVKIVILIMCSVFLFQLSSKATILLYLLFLCMAFIYTVRKKIIAFKIALPIIIGFLAISTFLITIPRVQHRFTNMIDAFSNPTKIDIHSQESTALRMLALKSGLNIIGDNFWTGVGTGDLSVEMSNHYKEHDYQGAYIHHISPHNQFIRSFVTNGVAGFISVVSIFVLMFYMSYKHKNFLMFFWALTMLVLFGVEDIFGIQDGIIYFCFYTSYFVFAPDETVWKSNLIVDEIGESKHLD